MTFVKIYKPERMVLTCCLLSFMLPQDIEFYFSVSQFGKLNFLFYAQN